MRRDVRLDELKLVVPVRDPDTNKLKDVVLDRMDLKEVLVHTPGKVAQIKAGTQDLPTDQDEFVPRESEKAYELEDYKWKTLRYIPSTNTEIVDHSEKDDAHDYDQEYHAHDTLAIAVDEQTYWPEIIEHPMPSSVLKEISLRDRKEITKYSEKIEDAIKERAEAKMRKQFELEDRIRTPLQELKLELKRTQREALKARKAEFVGAVDSEAAQKPVKESRSRLTVYEDGAEVEKLSPAKTQPVSDIVVTIGQAMARNWAQNPHVVTGNRKRLLEKVLEQEGATPAANSEACV